MPAMDVKFSNFVDGGDLEIDDIVVGLRNGLNTRFSYQGGLGQYLPLAGGTMSGGIDMDNNIITGLPLPSANSDAANKEYVDSLTAAVGAVGTIQRSNGTNWVASTATFADTYGASTILYSNGADTVTGLATANSAVLVTDENGVPSMLGSMTDGQLLIGKSGDQPVLASLTPGTGISITPGAGTITINASASGITWSNVAGTSQNAAVDNGYICTNAGATTVTCPATAAIGATIQVEGLGAAGWILTANAGQTIQIGTSATSSGGTLTSAASTDNVQIVCVVANTTWRVQRTNSSGLTIA